MALRFIVAFACLALSGALPALHAVGHRLDHSHGPREADLTPWPGEHRHAPGIPDHRHAPDGSDRPASRPADEHGAGSPLHEAAALVQAARLPLPALAARLETPPPLRARGPASLHHEPPSSRGPPADLAAA